MQQNRQTLIERHTRPAGVAVPGPAAAAPDGPPVCPFTRYQEIGILTNGVTHPDYQQLMDFYRARNEWETKMAREGGVNK